MTTSILMIHLKCIVVHCTNLNWSSKTKPFLNYGSLNMLFRFFRILIYVYFNEAFVKIQNSFITQSPLLISNIATGAEQFLASESPWKIMKNTFYFILTNWICYWQIKFCTYYEFSLNQMSNISEVWKYWPLKDDFRLISRTLHFVVGGPKSFKLLPDICFESSLQNTVLPSLLLFLCA